MPSTNSLTAFQISPAAQNSVLGISPTYSSFRRQPHPRWHRESGEAAKLAEFPVSLRNVRMLPTGRGIRVAVFIIRLSIDLCHIKRASKIGAGTPSPVFVVDGANQAESLP